VTLVPHQPEPVPEFLHGNPLFISTLLPHWSSVQEPPEIFSYR